MTREKFGVKPEAIDEFVSAVVSSSPFATASAARDGGLSFGLDEVRDAMGIRHGEGAAYELYDFSYLLVARQAYLLPPGFGAKAIFPVIDRERDGTERFRVEVCVDGGPAVRSPPFDPGAVLGDAPADFDVSVLRLRQLADRLAQWGTNLIPSARSFAERRA